MRAGGVLLVCLAAAGCTSVGSMPTSSQTQVDLARKNYKVVRANAIGKSHGFCLLGIVPLSSPTYADAMTELYRDARVADGNASALTNVSQEESSSYFVLFSVPALTVRADVVEFTE
jgi:uncharacterized protein DUF6567